MKARTDMPYKATIDLPSGKKTRVFATLEEATAWLDSENNNLEYPCSFERIDGEDDDD